MQIYISKSLKNQQKITKLVVQQALYQSTATQQQSLQDQGYKVEQYLQNFKQRLSEGPQLSDFIKKNGFEGDQYGLKAPKQKERKPKPDWLKLSIPSGEGQPKYNHIKQNLRTLKLHTVCEEAKCPNIGECWGGGDGHTATATIMIMGDTCTRGCRFCAVKTAKAPAQLDQNEPENVSKAIAEWGLDYVVLTSVDRDDIEDGGASHFAETIRKIKQYSDNKILVEALTPDFQGNTDCVKKIIDSGVDVYAHNVETVERLQPFVRDMRANWKQSISVLESAKSQGAQVTKTSIMLGCGETQKDVIEAFVQLRNSGVDVVTLGQYLRPTKKHMAVSQYITPTAFQEYQKIAEEMGFLYVAAGPMVRSSYRAGEFFIKNVLQKQNQQLKNQKTEQPKL